jgi:hypothetical protein
MILVIDPGIDDCIKFVYEMGQRGYVFRWYTNFYNRTCRTIKDNILFQAVILELVVNHEGLPKDAIATAKESFPGWAFYKHVLNEHPELQARTIIRSRQRHLATLETFIDPDKFKGLTIIDKDLDKCQDSIINILNGWDIHPSKKSEE